MIDKSGACWLWRGCIMRDGYGKFTIAQNHHELAHRFAWSIYRGAPPVWPMQLDHLCKVRNCVNPDHMEIVTLEENHRRRRLTHCKRGHEQTETNRYKYMSGGKSRARCLPCINERNP